MTVAADQPSEPAAPAEDERKTKRPEYADEPADEVWPPVDIPSVETQPEDVPAEPEPEPEAEPEPEVKEIKKKKKKKVIKEPTPEPEPEPEPEPAVEEPQPEPEPEPEPVGFPSIYNISLSLLL